MKNVYFDVSGIAIPCIWEKNAALVAKRIRQIGTSRLLYGSALSSEPCNAGPGVCGPGVRPPVRVHG